MKQNSLCKKLITGAAVTALLAFAPSVFASSDGGHGGGHGAAGKSMTPMETIKAAIQGNSQFTGHHDNAFFEAYQTGQTPNLTVVTCADSRVHTGLFGMDPNNNIFIIRNVGNQVANSEGSVDYGVRHLPTKILLIMGHSSCGAVKAAMGDYSGETKGIKAELDPLKPVMAADDQQGEFKTRWDMNVERNVDYQVKYAMELYAEKISSGEMAIVGGVYDFNNNYGKGRGTLVITNINGEADPNKIMRDPLLQEIPKGDIVTHVGSLAPAMK
ncbi:MAG: carbonic anhydrase [Proteobacteria bacterium]|nr:carbonic anhydrase [Pseudomonadota bacterium]MBU1710437.1 carbonic anhydrase [Pseudomonadota bacterium]